MKQIAEGLSERIAQQIAQQIIVGELAEGERIQELRIAKEMNVSRGSVREALLILQQTFLIQIYPRRGAVVTDLNTAKIESLFETMNMLLATLVQRLCELASPQVEREMHTCVDALAQCCEQGHVVRFYDEIFTFMLLQSKKTENQFFFKMFSELFPSIQRSYFLTVAAPKQELKEEFTLICLVIDAILVKKPHQAALFIDDFCRHLRNLVIASLHQVKQAELVWAKGSNHE